MVKQVKYTEETIPLGKKIHASISGNTCIGIVIKSKTHRGEYYLLQNIADGSRPAKAYMLGFAHAWVFRFSSRGSTSRVILGKLIEDEVYEIF